jgi:hypothetical protein
MPGVKAQPFRDFVPQSGTLLFLDYQSNATIGVNILPNFDGDAYPHTVLEMALSNPRPLTDIEQLESVAPHDTDIATLAYVEEMVLNPEKFVPETTDIVPNIDPDRMLASLRINDISGPSVDKIWEEETAPDSQRRIGFRFGRARHYAVEGETIEIPVFRSAPFDEDVTVHYWSAPIADSWWMTPGKTGKTKIQRRTPTLIQWKTGIIHLVMVLGPEIVMRIPTPIREIRTI